MTVEELNQEIYDVIYESTETELELTDDLHLITQMGLSSVEIMLMISDLEDRFGIELPVSELRNVSTVGQLCCVVLQALSGQ
jgi:acyl carrier protein